MRNKTLQNLLRSRPALAWTCVVLLSAANADSGTTPGAGAPVLVAQADSAHQRLRVRNDFKTPEEVVQYYCARDASGFVWSGLLDAERRSFTTWEDVPQADTFFIARKYDVLSAKNIGKDAVQVEVRYELTGIGDAFGTRMPPPERERRVSFELRKVAGAWKITKPDAARISPVVLEAKFPGASQANTAQAR